MESFRNIFFFLYIPKYEEPLRVAHTIFILFCNLHGTIYGKYGPHTLHPIPTKLLEELGCTFFLFPKFDMALVALDY